MINSSEIYDKFCKARLEESYPKPTDAMFKVTFDIERHDEAFNGTIDLFRIIPRIIQSDGSRRYAKKGNSKTFNGAQDFTNLYG